MQPRVGGGDDRADGLLVEALEALAPLQVLHVAADRPIPREFLILLAVDPAVGQGPVGPMLRDRPPPRDPAGLLVEQRV